MIGPPSDHAAPPTFWTGPQADIGPMVAARERDSVDAPKGESA